MTRVDMIPSPPICKLGAFDVDQFLPADDRRSQAMKLNGLLVAVVRVVGHGLAARHHGNVVGALTRALRVRYGTRSLPKSGRRCWWWTAMTMSTSVVAR